jgi:L-cysteine/cystine lyase
MAELPAIDLETVRAGLPALASLAYLNTGTQGPLPAAAAQAMREAVDEDERRGRISAKRFEKIEQQLAECRALMGAMVGVAAGRIALTGGTVDGVRAVLERLDLARADRVVTTSLEHPAAVAPLAQLAARRGLQVETVGIATGATDVQIVADFGDALAAGAKLVLVSHVAYSTGRLLPVAGIAKAAHAAGALVLVDGAQAVGAIGVGLAETGADFYAFPGQKWLLGPEGAGALAVAQDAQPQLCEDLSELERGIASKPVWAGMRAALAWRRSLGGEAELSQLIAGNAVRLRARLAAISGVEVVTPAPAAGIVTFGMDGVPARALVAQLGARRLGVRDVPGTEWVRVSCGFFNTEVEFDAVAETVAELWRRRGMVAA